MKRRDPSNRPRAQRPQGSDRFPTDEELLAEAQAEVEAELINNDLPALAQPVEEPPKRARFRPAIETVLLASTAALLAAVAWPIATSGLRSDAPAGNGSPPTTVVAEPDPEPVVTPAVAPKIQIALLLDTSSSMDGLIDQARSQLWRVVNALDSATYHGAAPTLEIAVYEYGNDNLDGESGWIRQVSPFTVELDRVSEKLFALQTFGGDERAGQVIARSIDELQWADGPGTLKVMYIAGNESFAQGPVAWQDAIEKARAKGVVVNTVLCDGVDDHWSAAARMAGGKFMAIDHNAKAVYVEAPQDADIARLGNEINNTYIGYGGQGRWGAENQMAQDDNAAGSGEGSKIQRALTKGSLSYRNPTWDLVDAADGAGFSFSDVDKDTLPAELQDMTEDEIEAFVGGKKKEREALQAELRTLSKEREAFVTAELERRHGEDPNRLDTAIVSSILDQAVAAGFSIDGGE